MWLLLTYEVQVACLGGDRLRILPTLADAADEVNEQDKVVLAPCPLGTGKLALLHPEPRSYLDHIHQTVSTLSVWSLITLQPLQSLQQTALHAGCTHAGALQGQLN